MNSNSNTDDTTSTDQREALKEAEKKAAEKQPGSYKDKETEEKLVEIGPNLADNPIKGIDPVEDATRRI